MKRKAFTLLVRIGLIAGMVWVVAVAGKGAPSQGRLQVVRAYPQGSGSALWLGIEGDYSFGTIQAASDTLLIDLVGAKAGGVSESQRWGRGLLAGYRLVQFTNDDQQPVLRVQLDMKHPELFTVQKEPAGLRLLFGRAATFQPAVGALALTSEASLLTERTERQEAQFGTPGRTLVSGVSISQGSEGVTIIEVLTSGPASYRVFPLQAPARIVVDLEGARFTGSRQRYAARSSLLKGVRVGQFRSASPSVVRIVADVAGNPSFDVHARRGGVRLELKSRFPLRPATTGDFAVTGGAVAKVAEPYRKGSGQPVALDSAGQRRMSVAGRERGMAEKAPSQVGSPAASVTDYQGTLPGVAGAQQLAAARRREPRVASPESLRAAQAVRILRARDEESLPASLPQAEEKQEEPPAAPPEAPPAAPPETPPAQTAPETEAPVTPPAEKAPEAEAPVAPPAQTAPEPEAPVAPPPPPPPPPPTPEEPAPAAQPRAIVAPEKPQYTGEPISLNLKDVDLKDFFRLVHEISGLNIIVDPNVSGNVTLVLDSVPWDQALDIVLKNNRLDKTLEGNVLRIARVETLAAEQEEVKKLADARLDAQPLVTVFRPVNYAKASTIQTMLKGWVGGGALTKRGNVLVDDRANTLIISDIQSQIPIIEAIISKLDTKAKQISIEARIVLATASFQRTLTAVLQGLTANRSGTTQVAGGTGIGVTATATTPPVLTSSTAGGFGVFAISNATSRYAIDAAIAAAETKSQARTISRPTIVTQNNVQGSVQQGSQIPIQTTINNTISIQYIPATLQLSVTPQVTEDGNIFLVITVQNASPGPALTQAGPSINTQSANTQVLVPDGGTVVFGGVSVSSRLKSATYVPLLGSIPILGHLFKSSNVQDSDNELLFFVTPKVLA